MTKKQFAERLQQLEELEKHMEANPGGIPIVPFKGDDQVLQMSKERMFLHFKHHEIADRYMRKQLVRELDAARNQIELLKGVEKP